MASTPYVNTTTFRTASAITAVATTAATATTPYGYSQAQADAIVASLNAVIALLKSNGMAVEI